ncbi:winged helix-turn-helix domain-containing protein [Sphingobium sp. EM0848]|uniref:winged helix-turn-helix domain-containing protein n=1 Tax=Sphingobium sp. EM0848 TaxID=2743473 RepID=UPI00159CB577|nr:winged helix-turn-helix domain-containing protein [Sphingobium sp. EM0848]
MPDVSDERWQIADLTMDVGRQQVMRAGSPIPLPQLSFRFLLALVRSAPLVLSVDQLMEQVWKGIFVNGETVTQRAKLLRDALGDNAREPRYFSVRRGTGYQLIPEPIRLENGSGDAHRGERRRRPVIMAAVAIGLMVAVGPSTLTISSGIASATENGSPRVAVLAFDNLSSDPSDAFIARSIPEMVLDRLSSVHGLTVIARDSALLSPAATAPSDDAARQLRAAFIVKGSVQRVGDTLRVTCFVVDAGRQARIWSERFDWPVRRIYALQDRIAERVAVSLASRTPLGSLPEPPAGDRNGDAYLAYLKGKSLLSRFTILEADAAALQFERAVALKPDFPEALIALYDARMQAADLRKDDLAVSRARFQPLLDKALKAYPESGPGLFAKAMWSDVTPSRREILFRRAAELDPSNSRGLTAYAEFLDQTALRNKGSIGVEGKALVDRVLAIDPLSPRTRWWAVQRRWSGQTPEEVEQGLARELAIDPQNYTVGERYAFRRWMFHGQSAEAIERIERVIRIDPQNPSGPHFGAAFYLDADDPEAARSLAATTPASRDASRILFAQYVGDWRAAGEAAYDRRGFLFNAYQNWNWPEAVRDHALHTREYDRGIKAIESHFGFDLEKPPSMSIARMLAAPALAHLLLAKGDKPAAMRLLAATVQWIDTHPRYGLGGFMRYRAEAMMLLGDHNQALSNLRASVESGDDLRQWWYLVRSEPIWAPVHADPRFQAIADLCRQAARVQRAKLDVLRRAGKVPVRPMDRLT